MCCFKRYSERRFEEEKEETGVLRPRDSRARKDPVSVDGGRVGGCDLLDVDGGAVGRGQVGSVLGSEVDDDTAGRSKARTEPVGQ